MSRTFQTDTMLNTRGTQTLTLNGLRFDANLGILDHEKTAPQPIQVDAELNLGVQPLLPRDDDIRPARQGPADALPGAPAHQHRVAQREQFEVLEIKRQMPGQLALAANHAIFGGSHDKSSHIFNE